MIWEFQIERGNTRKFETAYGPKGAWARLFRRAPGYLGSELLRDRNQHGRYVTIDRWISYEAYRAFRFEHAAAYQALDLRCEALTSAEREIGAFEALDSKGGVS